MVAAEEDRSEIINKQKVSTSHSGRKETLQKPRKGVRPKGKLCLDILAKNN